MLFFFSWFFFFFLSLQEWLLFKILDFENKLFPTVFIWTTSPRWRLKKLFSYSKKVGGGRISRSCYKEADALWSFKESEGLFFKHTTANWCKFGLTFSFKKRLIKITIGVAKELGFSTVGTIRFDFGFTLALLLCSQKTQRFGLQFWVHPLLKLQFLNFHESQNSCGF